MFISFRGDGMPAVVLSVLTRVRRSLPVGSGAMFLYSFGTSIISEPKGLSLALRAGFVRLSVSFTMPDSVVVVFTFLVLVWSSLD